MTDAYVVVGRCWFDDGVQGEKVARLQPESFGSFAEAFDTYRHNFVSAEHVKICKRIDQVILCGHRVYRSGTMEFA